ncbi:hypothetical protein [Lentzea sp. NEAU-D7]|uniref:hypothetical protein n=1 Tax=Lentzea sp. NEAU-D7 TaxID=2994667 RepID=UPI00224AD802|nr:hypothetical protein [Lentzea sp. NEAU-D7]MCX2954749.1 hypothetical protein [Lentzea sp. NEAU-D7]
MEALGCDAFVTASCKWHGTHAGALWLAPGALDGARLVEQVPSAEPDGPGHLQLGTGAEQLDAAPHGAADARGHRRRAGGVIHHQRQARRGRPRGAGLLEMALELLHADLRRW